MEPHKPGGSSRNPTTPNQSGNKTISIQESIFRPILEMQNRLMLSVFHHYIRKNDPGFFLTDLKNQQDGVLTLIQQDTRLRNMLVGMVVGWFTPGEWAVYARRETENKGRLISMIIQRLIDQLEELNGSEFEK